MILGILVRSRRNALASGSDLPKFVPDSRVAKNMSQQNTKPHFEFPFEGGASDTVNQSACPFGVRRLDAVFSTVVVLVVEMDLRRFAPQAIRHSWPRPLHTHRIVLAVAA